MRAGPLRRRFTVLEAVETRQTNGEATNTYTAATPPVKFWGSLKGRSGRELYDAQTDRTEMGFTIVTRYRTDLTAKKRLSEGSTQYQIDAPPFDPDGRKRETHIPVVILG